MRKKLGVLLLILPSVFYFTQCAEDPTPSLYDPNAKPSQPNPVISSVEPAEGTYSGIGEVTITGQNFSSNMENIHVYFDGEKGTNISASVTEVKVIVPIVSGDSVRIKIRVDGAISYAEFFPYKLEIAAREYGGVDYISDAYGVACDLNENLYISLGESRIIKVTPDELQEDFVTVDQGVDGFYGAMRIGPNGDLFAVRTRFLYRAPAAGGSIARASGRLSKRPIDFDFDENYNIFYAATDGIYLMRPDYSSDTLIADYPDYTLLSLRVYDGYVYVGGRYTGSGSSTINVGIWRNHILSSDGVLGAKEDVFNLEDYAGIGAPDIFSLAFAGDGYMYFGNDSTASSEAVTVVRPEGGIYLPSNASSLYEVLIVPPANKLCWGAGQYLYMNNRSNNQNVKKLYRLTMGKNSAPYHGRE